MVIYNGVYKYKLKNNQKNVRNKKIGKFEYFYFKNISDLINYIRKKIIFLIIFFNYEEFLINNNLSR